MEQPGLPLANVTDDEKWLIDVSDIIGELAKRHGCRVRRDDPTLMIVTAFELIARRLQAKFAVACERANDDTTAATLTLLDASKAAAERHVEAGAEYVANRLRSEVDGLAPVLAADVRKLLQKLGEEIGSAKEAVARSERRAWTAAAVAGVSSAVAVAAIIGLAAGRVLA